MPRSSNMMEGNFDPNIPQILPHDRMYNIQIGTKLFKISGASLSSDGPSYFTNYFIKKDLERAAAISNNNKSPSNSPTVTISSNSPPSLQNNSNSNTNTATARHGSISTTPHGFHTSNKDILFIDRSPDIFESIYKHLQGYFIDIKDEVQYTMLISDAVYYNLPRLKTLLKKSEYFYTSIGPNSFKFPKDLLKRNGDKQNYFQITSESLYIDVENLILSRKLLRPPPHSYSYVPRSPQYFQMILQLLSGSTLNLNDELRESLIKECRFYRFLNLEQRLIKCKIDYNPMTSREEIAINLDKIVKNGLSTVSPSLNDTSLMIVNEINRMLSMTISPLLNHHNNASSQNKIKNDLNKYMTMMDHEGLTPTTENILNFLKSTDDNEEVDVSNVDFINLQPSKRQKLDNNNNNNTNIKNNTVQESLMINRDNNTTQDPLMMARDNNTAQDTLLINRDNNPTQDALLMNRDNNSTNNSLWTFINYKRPFVDDYSRELSFQINSKDCTLVFNKLERMIYLDIVGSTAEKFESLFGPILSRSQGIDIQSYKIITTKPMLNDNNNNLSPNNSLIKTEKPTNYNTHLIIPTCLTISNTMINSQLYTGDFSEFFDCSSENVLDLPDMTQDLPNIRWVLIYICLNQFGN